MKTGKRILGIALLLITVLCLSNMTMWFHPDAKTGEYVTTVVTPVWVVGIVFILGLYLTGVLGFRTGSWLNGLPACIASLTILILSPTPIALGRYGDGWYTYNDRPDFPDGLPMFWFFSATVLALLLASMLYNGIAARRGERAAFNGKTAVAGLGAVLLASLLDFFHPWLHNALQPTLAPMRSAGTLMPFAFSMLSDMLRGAICAGFLYRNIRLAKAPMPISVALIAFGLLFRVYTYLAPSSAPLYHYFSYKASFFAWTLFFVGWISMASLKGKKRIS